MIGLNGGPEFGQSPKEFQNGQLYTWAKSVGKEIFKTTLYTPWMNGKAERAGKLICERARALMIEYNIPKNLWPFVVDTVVKVINLLLTSANPGGASPYEIFCNGTNMPEEATKPYIKHLRSYFCDAYYFVKLQQRV